MNLAETGRDCVTIASQAVGTESASVRRKWREEIRPYQTKPELALPSTWQPELETAIIVTVRSPSPLEVALSDVRSARSGRDAYDRFSRAVSVGEGGDPEDSWPKLMNYLGEPTAPYKHLLLSCLADHEVELITPWVVRRIADLLSSSDREVARSAALALLAGGELSSNKLREELQRLHPLRRKDLEGLVGLIDGLE